MAIYHLAVKSVSRSTGRSSVAAAAYRAGALLVNDRDGLTHDYRGRGGVEAAFIVTPAGAEWAQDRSALWNAAEVAEKRKDAKTAREYELALPAELDPDGRRQLVAAFAGHLAERYGVAVDAALHGPHDQGDTRNHHAHVLTTTREVNGEGLGAKTRQLDVRSTASEEVEHLREAWGGMVNQALERAGRDERVDHRSYERQGLDIEPTVKLGHASSALERRAARGRPEGQEHRPVTPRGKLNALIQESRTLKLYVERGREWLRSVSERMKGLGLAGLFRGAGQVVREEQASGNAGEGTALAPDTGLAAPGGRKPDDDRDQGGPSRGAGQGRKRDGPER